MLTDCQRDASSQGYSCYCFHLLICIANPARWTAFTSSSFSCWAYHLNSKPRVKRVGYILKLRQSCTHCHDMNFWCLDAHLAPTACVCTAFIHFVPFLPVHVAVAFVPQGRSAKICMRSSERAAMSRQTDFMAPSNDKKSQLTDQRRLQWVRNSKNGVSYVFVSRRRAKGQPPKASYI